MYRLQGWMLLAVALSLPVFSQAPEPYRNPDLTPTQRAADLVSRMTLHEKVLQMQSTAPAIPHLGVPAYTWWNEALHGVAQGRATVFPQATGLAATWDTNLMLRIADIISTEARAKYNHSLTRPAPAVPNPLAINPGWTAGLTYWSPNINIFRDPRWGRGQETYGEDPHLTARMGIAFIKGLQGTDPHYLKTVATPKHFAAHSGPEPGRHAFNSKVSETDLVNTYLAAFRATIVEGKAYSIMCSYNAVNGIPACVNPDLLQKRLRDQWGFAGYVTSDCGAVDDTFRFQKYSPSIAAAAVAAVKAGTDLTCGTEYKSLEGEVKAGRITEAEINRSVERLFVARFRLGMFDPPERVPFSKITIAENDSAAHREAALEAERKAIVLLKNDKSILPLSAKIRRIALVGPSADDPVSLLGNYNGISSKQVTPLEGIQRQFRSTEVRYALGATYSAASPALIPLDALVGLEASYFDNPELKGTPKLRRAESRAYLDIGTEDPAVMAATSGEKYSVRWTATLMPPASGTYQLTMRVGPWNTIGKALLFLDGKELAPDTSLALEAGHKYDLRVEYRQPGVGGNVRLLWMPPAEPLLAEAEKVMRASDVVVLCAGLNSEMEGEELKVKIPGFLGGDRTSLDLPAPQEELLKRAVATGKPVIVILTSGSAISANYAAEHAAAVMEAWYGGEETGTAIAETLAGVNNPAGRLPVTFYRSVDQLPPFESYAMTGRTYRYFTGDPLYPFGFGLSYSTFAYSGLSAKRTATGATIRVTVRNTSRRDGDEVVQLYVAGDNAADSPIRSLRAFERIHLRAGESREVTFTLDAASVPKAGAQITVGGGQPLAGVSYVKGTL